MTTASIAVARGTLALGPSYWGRGLCTQLGSNGFMNFRGTVGGVAQPCKELLSALFKAEDASDGHDTSQIALEEDDVSAARVTKVRGAIFVAAAGVSAFGERLAGGLHLTEVPIRLGVAPGSAGNAA